MIRIRRDSKLFGLPVNKTGQRGQPRKYGTNRIRLTKRAGHQEGWQTVSYMCRGGLTEGRYKTFLATSDIVGGPVKVVSLEHASGNGAAYITTETSMTVDAIMKIVSERWRLRNTFTMTVVAGLPVNCCMEHFGKL